MGRSRRWIAALSMACGLIATARADEEPIVATTWEELDAALTPASAGRRIVVRTGDYAVARALVVPDGATLEGEGVMTFDGDGIAVGIDAATATRLRATATVAGDMVSLGDRSSLRGLMIEDLAGRTGGSVVMVASRAAGDAVSASIRDCEIRNPNSSGIAPRGPSGRALAVLTRNDVAAVDDPPPHDDAAVSVQVGGLVVRSPRGSTLFAHNFGSRGHVSVTLAHSLLEGGGIDAVGGVSRPDSVTGSLVTIRSQGNLYRPDAAFAATTNGWVLFGGAGAPYPGMVPEDTTFNTLRMHSVDDRLEGFRGAINARGAARLNPASGDTSWNHVELDLQGARLLSTRSDLVVFGGPPVAGPADGNTARVLIRRTEGSGPRENQYAHGAFGVGNRVEVVGNPQSFAQANTAIEPAPPDELFTSAR